MLNFVTFRKLNAFETAMYKLMCYLVLNFIVDEFSSSSERLQVGLFIYVYSAVESN